MAKARIGSASMDLDQRPEAEAFNVESLIAKVISGVVRIPKFQRDFRWGPSDVVKLLDSIYRGYPIGTLLFWKRPGRAQKLTYGSVSVSAPETTGALWVVDGQQRIASLTRVLAGSGFPEEEFALFFDVVKETFVRIPRSSRPPEDLVPLTEVLDSERLLIWLDDHREQVKDRRAVIKLGKRIREYEVPAYVVTTENEGAVREIFNRSNTTGKKMSAADVFNALHGSRDARSPSDLRDVGSSLLDLGFGSVPDPLLHKMLLATRGTDVSRGRRVPDLKPAEARQAVRALTAVARNAIAFLQTDAGIPHFLLLPYEQPLITLARFFALHPTPSKRSRDLLSRWLWRGALTGSHKGDTISTRETLEAIVSDENASIQSLLRLLKDRREDPSAHLRKFSFNHARCKIQVLAMLQRLPVSLASGETIAISSALFPPATIFDRTDLRGSLANRLIHPHSSRSLRKLVEECSSASDLASHAITLEAQRDLRRGDVGGFLRRREEVLGDLVRSYCERKAKWSQSDRPPLKHLIVSDDEGE